MFKPGNNFSNATVVSNLLGCAKDSTSIHASFTTNHGIQCHSRLTPLLSCHADPTNPSRLLATYGFHDTSPPATYCKLFPDLDVVGQDLVEMGFDYTTMVFYPESGGISEQVWDVMLYTLLAQQDRNAQQQFYQAHKAGDANTKQQFHQYYLTQTASALVNHIDEILAEISYCDGKLNSGQYFDNMQMIAGHNEFVRQTFLKVRANLQQMMM